MSAATSELFPVASGLACAQMGPARRREAAAGKAMETVPVPKRPGQRGHVRAVRLREDTTKASRLRVRGRGGVTAEVREPSVLLWGWGAGAPGTGAAWDTATVTDPVGTGDRKSTRLNSSH